MNTTATGSNVRDDIAHQFLMKLCLIYIWLVIFKLLFMEFECSTSTWTCNQEKTDLHTLLILVYHMRGVKNLQMKSILSIDFYAQHQRVSPFLSNYLKSFGGDLLQLNITLSMFKSWRIYLPITLFSKIDQQNTSLKQI